MKTWKKIAAIILLVTMMLSVFTSCKKVPDSDLTKIVVQTSWNLCAEFAPITAAILNGYYKDEGIEVELREGGVQGLNFLEGTVLLSQDNSIDIAIANDMFAQILAKDQGDFYVKTIGALWQINPMGLLVRTDSGIKDFSDIKNHPGFKIGLAGDDWTIRALADYIGVEISHFNHIIVGNDAAAFLSGQVDGLVCFWTTQVYQVEKAGIDYQFIPLSNIEGYSNPSLVFQAREDTINENPEIIERFLRATIRGITYCIENPDAAAETVINKQFGTEDLDLEHEKWMLNKALGMKLFDFIPDRTQYLNIDTNQVRNYLEFLFDYGAVKNRISIDEVIDFTFIDKLY